MKNSYVSYNLSKKSSMEYVLQVYIINPDFSNESDFMHFNKLSDKCFEYLKRNNYCPKQVSIKKDSFCIHLNKEIKREKILINRLKKLCNNEFKFSKIYFVEN